MATVYISKTTVLDQDHHSRPRTNGTTSIKTKTSKDQTSKDKVQDLKKVV